MERRPTSLLIALLGLASLGFAAFGACTKARLPVPGDASDSTLNGIFANFWAQMNANYVWWDKDSTDWDGVYKRYRPLFAKLDIHKPQDLDLAAGYFGQMTRGLIDSHYSIDFANTFLPGTSIFPALSRKTLAAGWHSPFPYLILDTAYLDEGYTYGSYIPRSGQSISALTGTIGGKILYFGCDGFALKEAYNSAVVNAVGNILSSFFALLAHPPSTARAIVLDVRSNPGGNVEDLGFLMGHLINRRIIFGSTRYKSGSGRLDYTPWIDAAVATIPGINAPSLPVIVLADNLSVSLAEAVVMVVRNMPSGLFIGETTWGATGPIADYGVYDDGPFGLTGILSVTESSAEFKYIDGKSYEGIGFTPDIPVPFDLTSLNGGRDAALETAIALVH